MFSVGGSNESKEAASCTSVEEMEDTLSPTSVFETNRGIGSSKSKLLVYNLITLVHFQRWNFLVQD